MLYDEARMALTKERLEDLRKEKKLSFTRMEDVSKRALQAIRKNKELIFHWRGGYLTREVLAEIL